MNEAQLYPVALLPLYRIRSKLLLWGVAGLAMALAVAGFVLDPPPEMGGKVTNRFLAVIVVFATAIAMSKLAEFERRLLIESMTDPLTGLLNRRGLAPRLTRAAARRRRFDEAYALLVVDVDHFKAVNDQHGHAAGDAVLVQLGGLLSGMARDVDAVARIGGEEFCLLLSQADEQGARLAADRLCQAVRAAAWPQTQAALTVSVGVAVAGAPDEAAQDVLARADAALLHAKAAGRDCVVLDAAAPH
jgi:diguanylate cyclase (GGDEF)-like protein